MCMCACVFLSFLWFTCLLINKYILYYLSHEGNWSLMPTVLNWYVHFIGHYSHRQAVAFADFISVHWRYLADLVITHLTSLHGVLCFCFWWGMFLCVCVCLLEQFYIFNALFFSFVACLHILIFPKKLNIFHILYYLSYLFGFCCVVLCYY